MNKSWNDSVRVTTTAPGLTAALPKAKRKGQGEMKRILGKNRSRETCEAINWTHKERTLVYAGVYTVRV